MLKGLVRRFRRPLAVETVKSASERRTEERSSCREVVALDLARAVCWGRILDISHRGLRVAMVAARVPAPGTSVLVSGPSDRHFRGRQGVPYRVAWTAERGSEWEIGLAREAQVAGSRPWADFLLARLSGQPPQQSLAARR